ncbi:uncharacterized protein DSM5745_09451 [Aspergillus mulundensis]|uniref:Ysc84 actin-binding domain-containing protein n=1 Tax=Aspergillus mulundensis TaxID=1810919 RepID=A0A3D8QVC0_9EURO|nr:Uncharacterized protein DSM5745_09451 [Aspergillus mulundensis]RDW65712.1 Uncharacterized protein DSM5745_09451 [Aspergillus mulundensis]
MPKGMHNPLPASLGSECKKAAQILDSFINGSWRGSPGRELPERALRNAKGLAILTVTKAGLLGSLRFGSGILIARLPDNQDSGTGTGWSPPSAISTFGLGFGGQAGFELTDFVFILNDAESIQTFSKLGSLTVSGNFSIAFGPLGRNAEIAGGLSTNGGGKMMSFAKTKGLFGGVSLESGVLVERRWANKRFYGRKVTAAGILGGDVQAPDGERDVEGLMRALAEVFAVGAGGDGGAAAVESGPEPGPQPDPQQPISGSNPELGPELLPVPEPSPTAINTLAERVGSRHGQHDGGDTIGERPCRTTTIGDWPTQPEPAPRVIAASDLRL